MSRPAKRTNEASPVDTIVRTHHESMTAPEMSKKFGYHPSSYHKAAKRVGVEILVTMSATEVVQKYHAKMTVYEMMEKFKFSHSHLQNTAKSLGVKIKPVPAGRPKSDKPAKVVKPRVKVVKPEPTAKTLRSKAMPEAKPRKESNAKNPDRFKMKKVSYEGMRMLPVGIDNQYFYVSQDASEEEIAQERATRRERIEAKKRNERLTAL